MSISNKSKTIVIGHKNPDTDSAVAATVYSELKKLQGEKNTFPAICGHLNERTEFLFNKFNVPIPRQVTDVNPQVKHIMNTEPYTISTGKPLIEAINYFQENQEYRLPVVDQEKNYLGMLSLLELTKQLFNKTSISDTDGRGSSLIGRKVQTTTELASMALKADILSGKRNNSCRTYHVYVAAMTFSSFKKHIMSKKPENLAVVVGDRDEIHHLAIESKVGLLIVTGDCYIAEDVIKTARQQGITIIRTKYDSATAIRRLKFSYPVELLVTDDTTFTGKDKIKDIRLQVMKHKEDTFPVVDKNKKLIGTFSKYDLENKEPVKLILVDHNELGQAVEGAKEVPIVEIIDHHRLGMPTTQTPVKVVNDVVGSTSTLVSEMFKYSRHKLTPELAGLLMGGVISDTLNLQSPTTTQRDRKIMKWLSGICNIQPDDLTQEFFSVGSIIAKHTPDEILNDDKKEFEGSGCKFAIAQVEEAGFNNFRKSQEALLEQLTNIRKESELDFFGLLITDIITQNSQLLCDGEAQIMQSLNFIKLEDNLYDLPGVLSRKKQLLPEMLSVLKSIS